MREFLSKCVIGSVPNLRETLNKYSNMSMEEVDILKQRIVDNLNVSSSEKVEEQK